MTAPLRSSRARGAIRPTNQPTLDLLSASLSSSSSIDLPPLFPNFSLQGAQFWVGQPPDAPLPSPVPQSLVQPHSLASKFGRLVGRKPRNSVLSHHRLFLLPDPLIHRRTQHSSVDPSLAPSARWFSSCVSVRPWSPSSSAPSIQMVLRLRMETRVERANEREGLQRRRKDGGKEGRIEGSGTRSLSLSSILQSLASGCCLAAAAVDGLTRVTAARSAEFL